MIAKSRRYEQTMPLSLSLHDIKCYVECHGIAIDFDLFASCIFMIDNEFIKSQAKIRRK